MAKKKQKRKVTKGIVHIYTTFNNTIVNITDMQGNTIAWASGELSDLKEPESPLHTRHSLRLKGL